MKSFHWQERLRISETALLGGAALAVGLGSGMGIWLFKRLIDAVQFIAFEHLGGALAGLGMWSVALLPVIGGAIVGLLVHFAIGKERHHGVAGIMEAVALSGGRLRYQRIPAKSLAAAISIGSGASVGPEDPSVQIGANLGSMIGQWLHLSDERMRSLVAAGAASGVAAAFHAPIAGVFFALEIILGEIQGAALGVVVFSSVIASVFTQAVSGNQPALRVPIYAFGSAWELVIYLGLGLFAGLTAAGYTKLLYLARDAFQLLNLPRWAHPLLAGAGVGLVGVFLPQIFGVGYGVIEQILSGEALGIGLLLILLAAKLFLTPLSIGGGFQGGVFAPALFIGATLGGVVGTLAEGLLPGLSITPPAFAMVGMAAVLAGAVHAPLTAVLLLFEMTNDYHIILPLMFSVVISMLVSQRLQRDSVYTLSLARKGIRLERGRDVDVLEALTVSEVMQPAPASLIENDTLAKTSELFLRHRSHGLPVLTSTGELAGVFTLQDLERTPPEEWSLRLVGGFCTRSPLLAFPDETIGAALRRMGGSDVGRMPVVERNDARRMVGWLRRTDLVRAYDAALARRAAIRHRSHQVSLGAVSGDNVHVIEVVIETGSPCANQRVSDAGWPRECIITSLRRGRQVFIPHGDTVLRAGDTLAIVAEGEAQGIARRLCKRSTESAMSSEIGE